jgi:ankyrin repeat protein
LSKGADVKTQGGRYGNALQAASVRGYDKIVKLLLDEGADINAQGGEYGSAVRAAWLGGHDTTVKLLESEGAIVEIDGWRTARSQQDHHSALHATLGRGHHKIARLLGTKDANSC